MASDPISQILGQGFSGSSDQIDKLAQALGLTAQQAADALRQIQQLSSAKLGLAEQFDQLNADLGLSIDQFNGLSQAAIALGGASSGIDGLGKSVEGAGKQANFLIRSFQSFHELVAENQIVKTAFAFNQVTGAIGELEHLARPVFDGLIAQNIELRQQILGVSATLAATQQVKIGGETQKDPIAAITTAGQAVSAQIAVLRKDSLELAGVTSTELVGSFQAIAQSAGNLGLNLHQAEKTTIALTAASTTLGISEFQRSQEIQSIARGEITTYNQLAKSLGISNEIVRTKAAEGKLYEFIQTKTEALRASQSLAATSFAGVTSNLKEISQLVSQAAGAPLLDLLLKELNGFYNFIRSKQEAIESFAVATVTAILDVVNPLIDAFQPAIANFGTSLGNVATALLTAFKGIAPILTDLGKAIAAIAVEASEVVVVLSGFLKVIADIIDPETVLIGVTTALAFVTAAYGKELLAVTAINAIRFFTNLAGNIIKFAEALEGLKLVAFADEFLELGVEIESTVAAAKAGSFAGFIAELGPLAAAAALAAAPLILLAAAAASITFIRYTKDLKESNKALDEFSQQTNKIGDDSIALGTKLKAAQKKTEDSKKSGIALSKEELEANKKLIAQGKDQIASIDSEIDSIRKLNAVGDENKANQASKIKDLEKQKELISGLSDNVTFSNIPLEERGTELDKVSKKAQALQQVLDNPVDQTHYNDAAKDQIASIKERVELQLLSAEEGAKRLRALAADHRTNDDTAKQAREAALKTDLDHQGEIFKDAQANIDKQVGDGAITQIEADKQVTAAKITSAQARIDILKAELKIAASNNPKTRLELEQAEAELAQTESKKREQDFKSSLEERDRASKIAQANIDERVGKGTIGEIESEKEVTALKAEEAEKRVGIIRTALDKEIKEGRGKGEFAKQLTLQAEEAEGAAAKAAKAVRDLAFKQKLQGFDEQQRILEGQKSSGLVGEQAFSDRSLAITQSRLDAELAQIQKQRATITDAADLKELDAKEADINKRRVEAVQKFEDEKIAILERSQKKALDLVKSVETDSDIETQKLLNKREIREAEASDRDLKAKRKITEEELKLEQNKTAALAALPALSDPQKEEERQSKIRASRLRTGDLTLQLLKSERELQESKFKVISDKIDQELKSTLNSYTEQEQGLQRLSVGRDLLVKNLERQNALLTAQKELQSAISGYVSSEFQLAESLTQSEFKKHKLREEAARARLAFLDREQALERQSLELELLKNKALLDREKIQNQIAQSKSEADLAKSEADREKVNADPKATAAEKRAADLSVKASQDSLIGTKFQGKLLDQQSEQDAAIADAQRRKLDLSQELKRDQARGELAKETIGKQDDIELAREAEGKARNAVQFGDDTIATPRSDVGKYEDFYKSELAKLGGRPDNATVQQQINRIVQPNQAPVPIGSSIQQPLPAGTSQAIAADNLNGLKAAIGEAISQGFAKLKGLGTLNQTNSIVTNLNGAEATGKNASENVNQQILNTLYGVGILAKAQKATT